MPFDAPLSLCPTHPPAASPADTPGPLTPSPPPAPLLPSRRRCGTLPFVFEPGFGFERYAEYMLDVPMYFVYRDGTYHDVSGQSFRDFMRGALPGLPGALRCAQQGGARAPRDVRCAAHTAASFAQPRSKR